MTRQLRRHEMKVLAKQIKKMQQMGMIKPKSKPVLQRVSDFIKKLKGENLEHHIRSGKNT